MRLNIERNMRLADVMAAYPETGKVFALHGLGNLVSEETLQAIGPFITIETALQTHGIAVNSFMELLRESCQDEICTDKPIFEQEGGQGKKNLLALMPCGLKVPFARDFASFMSSLNNSGMNCSVESNLNHEVSYYPYVSHIESVDELPDMILSSDFNAFYHHRFYTRFVEPGHFAEVMDYQPDRSFVEAGISDPDHMYNILCVNPLIIVADLEQTKGRPLPRSWSDLLDPVWRKSITLRGDDNFFCHAVLLPLFKEHGAPAMEALAHNILDGRHPAQMVKTAGSGKSAAIYVMPYFFAHKIQPGKAVKIIWPDDGALASPITLLVKKEKLQTLKPVVDYLVGRELAQLFAGAHFPTPRPDVQCDLPPNARLKWLGWDYIHSNDIEQINAEIDRILLPIVNKGGGS